jgi:hypothetical protein
VACARERRSVKIGPLEVIIKREGERPLPSHPSFNDSVYIGMTGSTSNMVCADSWLECGFSSWTHPEHGEVVRAWVLSGYMVFGNPPEL